MYRLNVAGRQYEACVQHGLFALDNEPRIPSGEILLLQLNKADWKLQRDGNGRIRHALVFHRAEVDLDGSLSTQHWPNAGKVWRWIVRASAVLEATPFSLEDLPLDRESHYQSQRNLVRIDPSDESRILPFLRWKTTLPLGSSEGHSDEEPPRAEDTAAVEEFAVLRARNAALGWFPNTDIEEMPRNNPGFDLIVRSGSRVVRYIEVKGTRRSEPMFMMTETERRFSARNSDLYTVAMVWNIDLISQTFTLNRYDGEVRVGSILRPLQYTGRFPVS